MDMSIIYFNSVIFCQVFMNVQFQQHCIYASILFVVVLLVCTVWLLCSFIVVFYVFPGSTGRLAVTSASNDEDPLNKQINKPHMTRDMVVFSIATRGCRLTERCIVLSEVKGECSLYTH